MAETEGDRVDDDRPAIDIKRLAQDPTVFRVYYRAHFDIVQTYLARRLRDPERVADLTADVFLAAIEGASRYRAAEGTALAWTYGIARNVLLADMRRTERERRAIDRVAGRRLLTGDDISAIEERIDAQAAIRQMVSAIGSLAQGQRDVLEFVAVEGLTVREAAAALGISTVAARVRLHRARRLLRQDHSSSIGYDHIVEATQ